MREIHFKNYNSKLSFGFLTNFLLTILNAIPKAIKLVINPPTPPKIRSSVIVHIPKNTTKVGTEIIIAIKEPLATISFVVIFFEDLSVNGLRWDSAYKNQRCFIFGKTDFVCIE